MYIPKALGISSHATVQTGTGCRQTANRFFVKNLAVRGLFFWFEHPGCSACDKSSRNQSFAVRAQIIPKPRNDVALSSGKSFEPGARHFLRRLRSVYVFGLTRDGMKFRFGRARAQRANTDSVRLQFFRDSFRKQQVESLGRRV